MDSREKFYSDYEEFADFIEKGLEVEDVTSTEVVAISGLERQKAQLEAQRIAAQQSLEDTVQKIAKLDAQIARMKST